MFDLAKRNNLIVIDKSEVRKYWSLVKAGLEYMHKEGRNGDGWIPEDVYEALIAGKASLAFTSTMRGFLKGFRYVSRESAIADSSGFVVLMKNPGYDESALHIWVAVSNGTTKKADAGSIIHTFGDDINELARGTGCQSVTFCTNQDSIEKIAPRFGFDKQFTKWRRAVP